MHTESERIQNAPNIEVANCPCESFPWPSKLWTFSRDSTDWQKTFVSNLYIWGQEAQAWKGTAKRIAWQWCRIFAKQFFPFSNFASFLPFAAGWVQLHTCELTVFRFFFFGFSPYAGMSAGSISQWKNFQQITKQVSKFQQPLSNKRPNFIVLWAYWKWNSSTAVIIFHLPIPLLSLTNRSLNTVCPEISGQLVGLLQKTQLITMVN